MKLAYAIEALKKAIELADAERDRIEADASRLRKLGIKELAAMAEKRWNALSCDSGWLRRLLEELERDGRITIDL